MPKPKTHSEYIASFPLPVRRKLKEMRAIIKDEAPDAQESISYGVAAFNLNGPLVYIAGFKHHVSFFPTSSGIRAFKTELAHYRTSAGTVRFALDEPLPVDLLRRMVRYRLKQWRKSSSEAAIAAAKSARSRRRLSFQSRLVNWAAGMDYFAIPVPKKVTTALGTTRAVLVMAQVNGSEPFKVSLFPAGGGQHYIRVRAKVRRAANLNEGDLVKVQIVVLDRADITMLTDP